MNANPRHGRARGPLAGLVVLALALGAPALHPSPAAAGASGRAEAKAGHVDFDLESIFGKRQPTVEIDLSGTLLRVASSVLKLDPDTREAAELCRNVERVRVFVFDEIDEADARAVRESSGRLARRLKKAGWHEAIRIRDDDDHVLVLAHAPKNADWLDGIAIIVVDEDDDAVFANITGHIRPEDVERLTRAVDID